MAAGLYTVSAWVRTSGGRTTASLGVSGTGGPVSRVDLPASATWTLVSLPGVAVTSGQLVVDVHTRSPGGFVDVDDVDVRRQP